MVTTWVKTLDYNWEPVLHFNVSSFPSTENDSVVKVPAAIFLDYCRDTCALLTRVGTAAIRVFQAV
jgi:hypothetical protein